MIINIAIMTVSSAVKTNLLVKFLNTFTLAFAPSLFCCISVKLFTGFCI